MISDLNEFFHAPWWHEVWPIVALSLKVALWGTLGVLPVAIALAYILATMRFWGWGVLNSFVHLPLVLPPVVTGYGLLLLFGAQGVFGPFLKTWLGVSLSFSWQGAAVAAAVMGLPLMVRALRQAFEALDPSLYETAAMLGANSFRRHLTLTVPLIGPGVFLAFILGFAKSLGEFGATITFVAAIPGETQTISSAIYALLQVPHQEQVVFALMGMSITLAVGALLLSEYFTERLTRYRSSDGRTPHA